MNGAIFQALAKANDQVVIKFINSAADQHCC
jgi:hypothetical protein